MNKNQIYNLFCFVGVMKLDIDLMLTSPDYIDEKTTKFFGFYTKLLLERKLWVGIKK